MKKNILVIDKEWDEIIQHDEIINEESGEIITPAWSEVAHKKTMKSVTVDMTPEEEDEHLANQPVDIRTYAQKAEDLIRERYSISDEIAILRQRDTKPDKFAEYNAYCEECKTKARNMP